MSEKIIKSSKFDEFLSNCIACSSNWSAMIMSGIKEQFPATYESLSDDKQYDFATLVGIVEDCLYPTKRILCEELHAESMSMCVCEYIEKYWNAIYTNPERYNELAYDCLRFDLEEIYDEEDIVWED